MNIAMTNSVTLNQPEIYELTPVQKTALEELQNTLKVAPIVGFVGLPGRGRTQILHHLLAQQPGAIFTTADMFSAIAGKRAENFDADIGVLLLDALKNNPLLVLDDVDFFTIPGSNSSIRPGFVRTIMHALKAEATRLGHRLVIVGHVPESWETPVQQFGVQAAMVSMATFQADDYRVVIENKFGCDIAENIDFDSVYRFSAHLNAYQLVLSFEACIQAADCTTEAVIRRLRDNVMVSNTRIEEVEDINMEGLSGHEEIIESLKTNIVIPMENRDLARKLGLKPKRGVLLFGPPGTGKTSIGRALAHQMKGKFFLIDGSFVSEPPEAFFYKLEHVVREAKENAPSVLFIDDADVLFQINHLAGLPRYLLSMLDGIESETSSGVCVVMTAMDVRPLPEALLRSGRIELWLETRRPATDNRANILRRWTLVEGSEIFSDVDFELIAEQTQGFTPADLRRLASDSKALLAADMVAGRQLQNGTVYFENAIQTMVNTRNRMAELLSDTSLGLPNYQQVEKGE